MSELLNNRDRRQEELKKLIMRLHEGESLEAVKADFEAAFSGVSAREIADMEQSLVKEGMPPEEIQRLCDVHAAVFKGSIDEIHAPEQVAHGGVPAGHPVHTLVMENQAITQLLGNTLEPALERYLQSGSAKDKGTLMAAVGALLTIHNHYTRKEMLIFPYMEKYGITAPPKVMWGVDDEIRGKIKKVKSSLESDGVSTEEVGQQLKDAISQVREMIFKEENILIPMIQEVFTQEDWQAIEEGSEEIGFTLLENVPRWSSGSTVGSEQMVTVTTEEISFDAGTLLPEEINAILNTLPLDMTYVDASNRVKYFTQGKERIFDRPKTILGREVKNCHPPKSVHVVEKIVEQLMSGEKDHEDFWIRMGERFVYIRYFAVRDKAGKYLGTLEITQDIKPIQEITGEKRLISE